MQTQETPGTVLETVGKRYFLKGAVLMAVTAAPVAWHAPSSAAEIKIGVIMEARPSQQPWSAAIFEAIGRLRKQDPSVKVSVSYNAFSPTKAEPVARQMLGGGHKILILHSFALNDVAHKLAKEFPKVPMSVSSFAPPVAPNLNIATASYLQIGYANCWLLAKLSKSKKIGFVGALPIPYAKELLVGCKLGAAAADKKVTVLAAYSGSFSDQQKTREQAQGLIDRGVDAIFPASATQDSLGGFQLCEQRRIPCAGWASDARRYSPNYAVTSSIVDWTVMIRDFISQTKSGNLKATTFDATYGNKGLIPQPFEGPSAKLVSARLRKGFAAVVKGLASGQIKLPKSKAHPCCP